MANNKDFIVKNAVEVGGPTKVTVGDAATGGSRVSGFADVSTWAYDSKSFATTSQSTNFLNDVLFKSDGTKMYTLHGAASIYQYSLSTAWDVSTASYDNKSFDPTSQGGGGNNGGSFNADGTKFYKVETAGDTIYEYDLSTAWDISTASYNSVSLSIGSQDTSPTGMTFNGSGTKMYLVGGQNDRVYQYSLSTAYDLSTASYDSVFFSVQTQSLNPESVVFNNDGTKMFISCNFTDAVYQYDLTTAYDISTASYNTKTFSVASQAAAPYGMRFSADGDKMYIASAVDVTVYQYSTGSTVTTGSFDLSTGNYFTDTPSADVEYTFSNAGDVQSFQLEVTPAAPAVNDYFSIDLYTGTGSEQTVTNNLDFSTHGGLLIIKNRTHTGSSHYVFDTVRGATQSLGTTTTGVEATSTSSQDLKSFNTDGFTLNGTAYNANLNVNGYNYVAWCFREAEGFLDIQTYTGNGTAGRTISHNLNANVGMILIKNRSSTSQWRMYNRGYGGTYGLSFPTGNQTIQSSTYWNDTDATTTEFTLGSSADVNANGDEYVAYIFAHNENIQVGIYNGDGTTGREIETGFSPQYVVLGVPTSGTWLVFDTQRGINDGAADPYLRFQEPELEDTDQNYLDVTTNGFTVGHVGSGSYYNNSGSTFLYIAIKSGEGSPTIIWDADIAWPSGTAPDSPAAGEKDIYTFTTDDGGTTYIGVQSGDAFS